MGLVVFDVGLGEDGAHPALGIGDEGRHINGWLITSVTVWNALQVTIHLVTGCDWFDIGDFGWLEGWLRILLL